MIRYQSDLQNIDEDQLQGFFVGWRKPLTREQHLLTLKNSSYVVLAIDEQTNKVVGFINALSDGVSFAFIPLLEVLPEYQNQGIGGCLVKTMLEQLQDISNIDLICDEDMQKFYQKFKMFKSRGMIIRKFL